jgi:hypothetical protein
MGMFNAVAPEKFDETLKMAEVDPTWDVKATTGSTVKVKSL